MVTSEAADRSTDDRTVSAGDIVAEAMMARNAPRIRLIQGGPAPVQPVEPSMTMSTRTNKSF